MNQKIKIMKRAPQLSDEEIRSYMDFDTVLQKQKAYFGKRNIVKTGLGLIIVSLVIVSSYLVINQLSDNTVKSPATPAPSDANANPGLEKAAGPITAPDSTSADRAASEKRNQDAALKEASKEMPQNKEAEQGNIVKPSEKKLENHAAADVYVQAEPADGYTALYEYFNKNLKYPSEAIADSIQGAVTVSFVISKTGSPDLINVDQNLGDAFKKEIEDLIQNMPPWRPATLNGNPVPSKITIPLTFKIEKIKN
jgi:TonB family protein